MNTLVALQDRFQSALKQITDDDVESLAAMITPTQDPRHGDYQANCAMPLGKKLGKPPREVATELVELVDLDGFCDPPEVAGPGFINLRLSDSWLTQQLESIRNDDRLGITSTHTPRTYIVDFSSPNVAKPMHVGHIRSTVIGDALCRTLRLLGHTVVSDNHLGDWGTQFGMIIYGYRHFADKVAYEANPVAELTRVYREVRALIDFHDGTISLLEERQRLQQLQGKVANPEQQVPNSDATASKKARKQLAKLRDSVRRQQAAIAELESKLAKVTDDPETKAKADEHADIGQAVLRETAKLHAGDPENKKLWNEFLPKCREDIEYIYHRLDVTFDEELGESFYHNQLANVVQQLEEKGIARESDGAKCIFLDGYDAPMIIQKRDGAYLYATTDLATIAYRMDRWKPDVILYVVDFRQGEHFGKLFDAASAWEYSDVEFAHVSFGTVLGDDGKAFKTRSGDTVSLEGLLDEAVARAHRVVSENDDAKKHGPELDAEQRNYIAKVVGHAAVKYADLSQNRTSDYVFSFDKMVATQGNTSTYLQYSYARIQNIFARGRVDVREFRRGSAKIVFAADQERKLAVQILRFHEALHEMIVDYRPNVLANYLFQLAKRFAEFYTECPVLNAHDDVSRSSRLLLCNLVACTMKLGLSLLGIQVVDKM